MPGPRPPFSARTAWPRTANRWSSAVDDARRRGSVLDLTQSNPTRVGLPSHETTLRRAWAETARAAYEPEPLGARAARARIREYYGRRGIDVRTEDLLLVASTSEAYGHLFRLLADPGDELLVPTPSYPLFQHLAELADVRLVPFPLEYDGSWHLPPDAFAGRISDRTRGLVLVSPNNPTGSILDERERRRVAQLARDARLAVISDEVFADFLEPPLSHRDASFIGTRDVPVFSMGGLSKAAGLPQVKAGWIALSGPPASVSEARARLELMLDAHLSVSAAAQATLEAVLPEVDAWQAVLRARLAENRAALDEALGGTPARRLHRQGGWSAIVELPALHTDEEWALLLLERSGVVAAPGYLFDLGGRPKLVVSLILAPEEFQRGVSRLTESILDGTVPERSKPIV